MEKPKELIGVLQAISVVAKKLAEKLIKIEQEIQEYEAFHKEQLLQNYMKGEKLYEKTRRKCNN